MSVATSCNGELVTPDVNGARGLVVGDLCCAQVAQLRHHSDIVVMAWPVKPLLETLQSLVRAHMAPHGSLVQVTEHFFLQCFRDHCLKPLEEVSNGLRSSAENALVHHQLIPKLEESAHGLA